MKFRTDFVTNSSDASFIIEIDFESRDGVEKIIRVDAEDSRQYLNLRLECKKNDILFSGKSIYSVGNLDELCKLVADSVELEEDDYFDDEDFDEDEDNFKNEINIREFDAKLCRNLTFAIVGELHHYSSREDLIQYIASNGGTVEEVVTENTDCLISNEMDSTGKKQAKESGILIITERQFIELFDSRRGDMQSIHIPKYIYKMIAQKREAHGQKDISIKDLTSINIKDLEQGWGDSAKWVDWNDCESKEIESFREQYSKASDPDEKVNIIDKMFDYIKSNPKLAVNDNEYSVEAAVCVWDSDDSALKQSIKMFLDGKKRCGAWMGELSREQIINIAERRVTEREIMYYGSLPLGK